MKTKIKNPIGYLTDRHDLTPKECKDRNLITQSEWYNHHYAIFKVVGPMDLNRIWQGLHDRFWTPSCGKFGGGTSIGKVTKEDDNHILVEFIYHIGD